MKPYRINFHSKNVARALVGFIAAGLVPGEPMDEDEKEALEIATRLGEWSEDINGD